MPEPLDELCCFLASVRAEDLPASVRRRACRVVADTVAVIAAGSAEPEMRALDSRLRSQAPGDTSVIGTGERASPGTAAFLNGTAGTFLELDEGNRFSLGHPAIHTLPSALAAAEGRRAPGDEFLLAFVLGYEVGARIGMGARLRESMHPHGTWGTVGSAVAVARLAGADAGRMRETVNVASTLALGASRETMFQGATVRNVFAGHAARTGLLVDDLVESGFSGERDGLDTVFGSVLSDRWDPTALVDGLGERWEIERGYFKRHACCRYNHGVLDALAEITTTTAVPLEDIHAIDVETYALAASLDETAPRNPLAGKFSVPFCVSTTLVHGSSDVDSFTWRAIRDPRVRALAARVRVREEPALSAKLPDRRPARVVVTLGDGTRLEGYNEINRGDVEDPYDDEELESKFFSLAERVWPRALAGETYDDLLRVDALDDVNALTRRLDGVAPR